MSEKLYITGIEEGSGKSLVLLGIMELLSKRIQRLGLFRPVIHAHDKLDNDIELILNRYYIKIPYESCYGLTQQEARNLLAEGEHEELIKKIIEKYKNIEKQCDFIVCEGTDWTELASIFNFDINSQIANHLAAPIILVANGQGKTASEVVNTVRAERETFLESGNVITATIVNRVIPECLTQIKENLSQLWYFNDPVFLIPEKEILSKPTVAEIAKTLEAKLIHGKISQLNREVLFVKVAAMQVTNFLSRLQDNCLVITPGDRADIILGCLATTFSENYPKIAGIIITGGLDLADSIEKLIKGFKQISLPIYQVEIETYETAKQISSIPGEITYDNERKIAIALGLFESGVDTGKIEDRIAISRSKRVTPIMFEYELIEKAKTEKQHIVLPEGNEERILRASEILLRRQVVDITLLGEESEIRKKIASLGLDLKEVKIIDPAKSEYYEDYAATYFELRKHKRITKDYAEDIMHDPSYFGTMMVYKGLADGMVSGSINTTANTIRPALEFIRTVPGCSIVSSVFLMCLEDRVLVYGDCAVNPNPNSQQLADIAISSAITAQMFGIDPIVAMLSYSTGESGKGEEVEKVRKATQIAQKIRPDFPIEGPIQYDAAIDESVAKTKLPNSKVAGHATVFIFPDLNTGNNTYKAVQRSADAVAIGPVLQGLKKPVNDLSRGCTITDIVNTVAITAIQAQALKHD